MTRPGVARLPGAQINPSFCPAPKSVGGARSRLHGLLPPPSLEFGGGVEGDTLQPLGVVSGTPPRTGPRKEPGSETQGAGRACPRSPIRRRALAESLGGPGDSRRFPPPPRSGRLRL